MNLVTIGKISGTHHLKGAVKSNLNINDPNILVNEKVLIIKPTGEKVILTVKKISRLVGEKYTIEFEEIKNKTEANVLHNSIVKINRKFLGLAEGEYLLQDLLGMKVFLEDKTCIGSVTEVFDTAAHDIIVVSDDEYEAMIPKLDPFIKNIDFSNNEIIVDLWEGMRELKIKK
ncbi:MAG: ribosome maturation factor RimM [Fusobacterium sp. JB021]|nr:ribosome maturation factor RimM [Fusobacterium sp. JB021]MDP0506311.1 ribosome maturation factor RimM [Fusobacterium sp. JB019]